MVTGEDSAFVGAVVAERGRDAAARLGVIRARLHHETSTWQAGTNPRLAVWLLEGIGFPYHGRGTSYVEPETALCCVTYRDKDHEHTEKADDFPQAVWQLGAWLRAQGLQRESPIP